MATARPILRRFIVFEGIDGSGTTTQLRRLEARLTAAGVPAYVSAEPTGSPVGRLIRQALSGETPLHPDTVARLFAADRGEHLRGAGGIEEALGMGLLAVSDRYVFSSLAYQGLTCGPELPAALNAGFPLPELLLFFELDPGVAMGRVDGRDSKEIYETRRFQERVAAAYRDVVASFDGCGMDIVRIDASLPVDQVEAAVREAVGRMVGLV